MSRSAGNGNGEQRRSYGNLSIIDRLLPVAVLSGRHRVLRVSTRAFLPGQIDLLKIPLPPYVR